MAFLFLVSVGCSSGKTYRDLQLPQIINHDFQKALTAREVTSDIEQLRYALGTAYSGRKFLPAQQFQKVDEGLGRISGSMPAIELCRKIEGLLVEVSDSHLHAQLYKDKCRLDTLSVGMVGKNFNVGDRVWLVRNEVHRGRKITLISIKSFPPSTSPAWNGFLDKVKSSLPQSRAVIIDLRGNDGGDDTFGQKLSNLLAGVSLRTPYEEQWQNQTAENEQLFVNTMELYLKKAKEAGEETGYLETLKRDYAVKRELAATHKIPESVTKKESGGDPFRLEKSVQIPIYLLQDRQCISSCESTIDFFEFNPLAKKVGENTGGFIHFGNNAYLVLKNSGVAVMMASTFTTYIDHRFIEKVGISPDIPVLPNSDAMNEALNDFHKQH